MKRLACAVLAASLVASADAAVAGTNLVNNGSFESSSYTRNTQFGSFFGGQGVTGWTGLGNAASPNPLEFYFFGGTQTTVNALNQFNDAQNYFYDSFNTLSPDGGNFVALAGEVDSRGQISQTINGLTVGDTYNLTFDYASAQLRNSTGATTEKLRVTFGSQTFDTPTLAVPSMAFSGWQAQSFTFKATSTSQVLSFLSIGSPAGLTQVAALDGISLTTAEAVPEPSTWAMMLLGFGSLGAIIRRRRAAQA